MKFSKRRVAWALFWLFAVFVLLPAAYIWNEGVHDKLGKADVAVVLGNKVELDGRPSDRLAARLDRALDVYRQGYVTRILVSGGIGKEGFDEAKVMAAYLVAKGVPKADIFEDPVGYDTFLTARNTALWLKTRKLTSVLVVSQWFHITRCRMVLQGFQVNPVYTAHADYYTWRDSYSIVRELVGIAAYGFRSYEL